MRKRFLSLLLLARVSTFELSVHVGAWPDS